MSAAYTNVVANGPFPNRNAQVIGFPDKPIADRLPPQNIEAEQSALFGCLDHTNPDVLAKIVGILKPEDFFRDVHATIYRAILVLYAADTPVDILTVCEELERQGLYEAIGGDATMDAITVPFANSINSAYHAEIVKQKSDMRRSVDLATRIISRAYSNLYTASQQVEFMCREVQKLAEGSSRMEDDFKVREYPPLPASTAYQGPLGSLVKAIEPFSEASPAAIMLQMLTAFGNMAGRGPHWTHEATRHHLNLFSCIVGPTAVGRKGTSWGYVEEFLTPVDEAWRRRVVPGVNSGEALIELVADDSGARGGMMVQGESDKRLLLLETEFARILAIFTRQGDSLSTTLRQFWETGDNGARSRKTQLVCTGAHVSLIAHVPPEELHSKLSLTDVANGLGNRFIWAWSIQSKEVDGKAKLNPLSLQPMLKDIRAALDHAWANVDYARIPIFRTATAHELWRHAEKILSEPRPGLLGAMLARSRPQVMRMAAIFAVADQSPHIDVPHLEAALELWDYSVRSVDFIFGERLGDKDGEKLLAAIRATDGAGLTQTDVIRNVFGGNKANEDLAQLLSKMMQAGLIHKRLEPPKNGHKPVTRWFLGPTTPPPTFTNCTNSTN